MKRSNDHEVQELREQNKNLLDENQAYKNTIANILNSRNKSECVFYEVPTAMFRTSPEGAILCVNRAFKDLMGYHPEQEYGLIQDVFKKVPTSIIPPERFADMITNGQLAMVVEFGLKKSKSTKKCCSLQAWPVIDENGNTTHIEGFVENISSQKRLSKALRESENRYRTLVERTQLGVLIVQNESIVYANEALARIGGYTMEDLFSLTKDGISSLIYPDDRELVWNRHFDRLAGKSVPSRYEFRLITKSGMIAWVEMIANTIELETEPAVMATFIDITERKRNERALLFSEKRLSQIIQSISIAIFVIDNTHTVTHWNHACELLTSINAQDIVGTREQWRPFYETPRPVMADLVLDQSDQATFKKYYNNRCRKSPIHENTCEAEAFYPSMGKSGKWLYFTAAPLTDDTGGISGAIETIQDITNRKATEGILRQNRQLLHFAIEQMPIPVVIANATDMTVSIMNTAAKQMLRSDGEDMAILPLDNLHKHLPMLFPDGSAMTTDELPLTRAISNGNSMHNNEILIEHSNERSWVSVNAAPLYDDYGNIIAGIMIFPDITERKEYEHALKQNEERIRLIINSSPDGIVIISADGDFVEINDAFTRIVGYSKEELMKTNSFAITPTKWHSPQRRFVSKILLTHGYGTFEKEYRRKDGVIVPVMLHCWRIPNQSNSLALYGAFVRDISKERAIDAQLRQSQKMEAIGTLAAGIAHDFNNALTSILMNTELLMDDYSASDKMKPLMDDIHSSGIRAKGLVEQILTFSRQNSRERVPTMLEPVIRDALKMLRASIPSTITFEQIYDDTCGPVLADHTQIHQIVINLVSNASHAMRESGGTITIQLNKRELSFDHTVYPSTIAGMFNELIVSDTGHGMNSQTIERVFDPFFTTKKTGEGTGMGLAVVHGIVSDYGGTITVKSFLGKGSTFTIMLPEYNGPVISGTTITDSVDGGTEHILFVDDETNINKVAMSTLGRLGYCVTCHESSTEALDVFKKSPDAFDLVITDYTMPNMTGLDLAKAIKNLKPSTPIILASGYNDLFDEKTLLETGIKAFVKKPFNRDSLAHIIRDTLDEN